jgi:hypothetical protein
MTQWLSISGALCFVFFWFVALSYTLIHGEETVVNEHTMRNNVQSKA